MEQPPDFLNSPLEFIEEETFQPTAIPHRGGIIAWMATVIVGIVAILTKDPSGQIPCLTVQLFIFFLLAAILITFSHWVDTKTIIHVTPSQLSYQSPFRRFLQNWDQISEIRTIKVGSFWRVLISGEQSSFTIRVHVGGTSKTQAERFLGLPNGDRLLRIVCGMAGLSQVKKVGEAWICNRAS